MADSTVATSAIALSAGEREATQRFAVALAETEAFRAFEEASDALQSSADAQQAVADLQSARQRMQAMLALNSISEQERSELGRLERACFGHPVVAAYVDAQREFTGVATAAASRVSEVLGLDYASACGAACGCGSSDAAPVAEDPPVAALDAAYHLAVALRASEPMLQYHTARQRLNTDMEVYALLQRLSDASARIRMAQASGSVTRDDLAAWRSLQQQTAENPVYAALAAAQQAAVAYLRAANRAIDESLGFDWISLVTSTSC